MQKQKSLMTGDCRLLRDERGRGEAEELLQPGRHQRRQARPARRRVDRRRPPPGGGGGRGQGPVLPGQQRRRARLCRGRLADRQAGLGVWKCGQLYVRRFSFERANTIGLYTAPVAKDSNYKWYISLLDVFSRLIVDFIYINYLLNFFIL